MWVTLVCFKSNWMLVLSSSLAPLIMSRFIQVCLDAVLLFSGGFVVLIYKLKFRFKKILFNLDMILDTTHK